MPFPDSFVVKKGSNIFRWVSLSMPVPVSEIDSFTSSPLSEAIPLAAPCSVPTEEVSIINLPPSGMASRAFTQRFIITCCICEGSAFILGRSSLRFVTISMLIGMLLCSSSMEFFTTSLISTGLVSIFSFRVIVRIFFASSAPFSAAFWIMVTGL